MFTPLTSRKNRVAGLGVLMLVVALLSGCGTLPTSPVDNTSSMRSGAGAGSSSAMLDGGAADPQASDPGNTLQGPAGEVTPPTIDQPPPSLNHGHGHAYGKYKH